MFLALATTFLFMSGGLFLGWSLGAHDAANVFGTAVGSKMLKFRTAAIICSIFVVLGATVSGAGASHTLGKLGAINTIAGAFTVTVGCAFVQYLMAKAKMPTSTSNAIVGSIIGWTLFAGMILNASVFTKIVGAWVSSVFLSGLFAFGLYYVSKFILERSRIHMIRLDFFTRFGLILVGAFGSYSLGANNIGNIIGVFIPISPFPDIPIWGGFHITSLQQLLFLGAISIAVGVLTYSHKVMSTVGSGIFKLSSVNAFVVIFSSSLVLFLFASEGLHNFMVSLHLPAFPLVPISSTQSVIGSIIGVGLAKSHRNINFRSVGKILSAWVITPISTCLFTIFLLFIVQNVFNQPVYTYIPHKINQESINYLVKAGVPGSELELLKGRLFRNESQFSQYLKTNTTFSEAQQTTIMEYTRARPIFFDPLVLRSAKFGNGELTADEKKALLVLEGQRFEFEWELTNALKSLPEPWVSMDKQYPEHFKGRVRYLYANMTPLAAVAP